MEKSTASSLKSLSERRKMFKPVLSNPYTRRDQWPPTTPKAMQDILDVVTDQVLVGIGNYNRLSKDEKTKSQLQQPAEARYLSYGFNSTMQALESQIASIRKHKPAPKDSVVSCVCVCKQDVTTPLLYSSFPTMCQLSQTKLVELPKGASHRLKDAIGCKQSVDFLVLRKGLLDEYPILSKLIGQIEDVDIGFLDKLGLDVKYLLVDQPPRGRR